MANQQWSTWLGDSEKSCNTDDNVNKMENVMCISRAPTKCPISGCNKMIGVSLMLSHYIRDHTDGYEHVCKEVNLGMRQTLIFDPSHFMWDKNYCLGALVYGGRAEDTSSRPAEKGLSVRNSMLPQLYKQFAAHLPVLIMVCRTTWASMLSEANDIPPPMPPPIPPPFPGVTSSTSQLTSASLTTFASDLPPLSELTSGECEDSKIFFEDSCNELLIIWLVSMQTTKPLHCSVSVYDHSRTYLRGRRMKLRPLNISQEPKDFAYDDPDCLLLLKSEIDLLSQYRTNGIEMEIVFDKMEIN